MSDSNFKVRCEESKRIMNKYPDRIPVIVNKCNHSNIQDIDKKYLVPGDMYIGQFTYIIRKNIKLSESEALFVTINNSLVPTNSTCLRYTKINMMMMDFIYCLFK